MIDVYRWQESRLVGTGGPTEPPGQPGEWLWVDVVGENPDSVRRLGQELQIDPAVVDESFAEASLPLVEEHVDDIFVVLHSLTTGGGERLSTPEIDVFIGDRFLLTVRDEPTETVDPLKERIAADGRLPVSSPAALLGYLTLLTGRHHAPLIVELERRAEGLEEMALHGDPRTVVEVHALRRDVIFLRRALSPQLDVYEDLSGSTHRAVDDEARMMFSRVARQHRRSLERLESGRAMLTSVLETYRGAVAEQTNEIMRVLTVFSAIMLPLTLIAGLWGMNFVEIPGDDLRYGFWGLVGSMAVLVIWLWVYFSRRGFIGAPRLRELPKSVGLGLYSIGTAPIRVVAGGIRGLGKTDDDQTPTNG